MPALDGVTTVVSFMPTEHLTFCELRVVYSGLDPSVLIRLPDGHELWMLLQLLPLLFLSLAR